MDNDLFGNVPIARVADELDAVVAGTEHATRRILETAEEIDRSASVLTTALTNPHERGLAQDIRDGLAQVFEACNFHDFTGQRVSKVMKTFAAIEHHILRMREIWIGMERTEVPVPVTVQGTLPLQADLLNGPKLPGDTGHFTQADIDSMFN
jgi:chemotaxis protein CheZ